MNRNEPTLYLVPTPIGNLGDITLRALEVLRTVDLIAAEDTRHSRILLDHYEIRTPLLSYHEHNTAKRREEILQKLADGQSIAVISDAGTPAISDPGADIAAAAAAAGFCVTPLPGASALLPALTGSGLDCRYFAFEGFLPRVKKERRARLALLAADTRTLIVYIAPHRCHEELLDLREALGNRPATLCRELTKLHESFYRSDLDGLIALTAAETLKGEMVLVIAGAEPAVAEPPDEEALRAELQALMAEGLSAKDAAKQVAARYQLSKNDVYPLTFA